MPRLLLFGICQKAIVDRSDETVSLIALIPGITVQLDSKGAIPDYIAMFWGGAAIWLRIPEDDGKTYEQRVTIVSPSGKEVGGTSYTFSLLNRTQQNIISGNQFPSAEAGEYDIQLWLREVGEENEWQRITSYPIEIQHQPSPDANRNSTANDGELVTQ